MIFKNNIIVSILSLIMTLFLLVACDDVDTESIFQPDPDESNSPTITSIEPSGFALAGFDEISITGNNFSEKLDDIEGNKVYFNNKLATIISASKTELKVISPNEGGNEFSVKVVVPNALKFAEFTPYTLRLIAKKNDVVAVVDNITALAMDSNENLFIHLLSDKVYKISDDGVRDVYGQVPYPKSADMKYGPNDYLYLLRSNNQSLYRIPPGGGDAEEFVKFDKRVRSFDFDRNLNIYALGTKTGTQISTAGGTIKSTTTFNSLDVWEVKIHGDFLYAAARGSGGGIFRAPIINADGDVGAEEAIFDWNNAGQYADENILGFGIAANGEIIVTTKNTPDPIVIIDNEGNATPLYPGILIPKDVSSAPVTNLVWGNGDSFYISRFNTNSDSTAANGVYKVFYGEGTTYFGR